MSQSNPYTANVNRAKTKKWVEAKSYSYDGDDWGEVDDYDEYGGYNDAEPEPEPASRPTGLRQRGQSASQTPQEAYDARQGLYQSPIDSRQPYGNLGVNPPQQQYGGRSFTSPHPKQHPNPVRTNSFDRDDDRRTFSAGGPQQPQTDRISTERSPSSSQSVNMSTQEFQPDEARNRTAQPQPTPARPPLHASGRPSMEAQPRHGEQSQTAGGGYRASPYSDPTRQLGTSSRTQSMTSNNSGLEFLNRRDFSPSAMPPPLQTRGSPSPHGPDARSASRHPPRKSSLDQDNAPTIPFPIQAPPLPTANDLDDDVVARDSAGSGPAKLLPFVRPADIYRRMEEEKEKERQSQDSSRPSMEAILGRSNERPALGKSQDSEASQRLKPSLDPVAERKSEYAMEGFHADDQVPPGERRPTSSKTFSFPKHASNNSTPAPQSSLRPMLPDVSRVSGFGESFFGSNDQKGDTPRSPTLDFGHPSALQQTQPQTRPPNETGLQHQPSLGFTSAVHQAFDKAEDQVPPTPSSTQGSSVARSTSGGTSTVSPIISRGPSAATDTRNGRLPGIDNISTPMIPEGPEGSSSRPLSSDSITTPTQITQASSPSQNTPLEESEKPPPSFIPGYRRSSDTPSLDNSPRKTAALETTRQLRQPQEVELAAATPTEPSLSTDSDTPDSEAAFEEESNQVQPTASEFRDTRGYPLDTQAISGNQFKSQGSTGSPMSPVYDNLRGRTDSSSSSRVRNLADKFESVSRPGSAHSTTPRASILGANAQKKEDLAPPRPLVDHRESFRPQLPGGWESSASIAPAAAQTIAQASGPRHVTGQNTPSAGLASSRSDLGGDLENRTGPSDADHHPSSVTQIKDASEEAFAAVAAAGSALVGAFGAAVGIEHQESPTSSTSGALSDAPTPQRGPEIYGAPIDGRGALHPEASRAHIPLTSDDEASTAAPTPLPKISPQVPTGPSQGPDYFPSSDEQHGQSSAHLTEEPRRQQPKLPLISTDTGSEQYESDRLRKEIVRELTPMSASEPTTAETDYSTYEPTLSTNPSLTRPGHESGVLPREYESYWNDVNSDDEVEDSSRHPAHAGDVTTAEQAGAVVVQPLQLNQDRDPEPSASIPLGDSVQERPQLLPHRFSWQQPLQDLPVEAGSVSGQTSSPPSDFLKSAVYPEGHSYQSHQEPSEPHTSLAVGTFVGPAVDRMSPSVPEKDLPVPEVRNVEGVWKEGTDAERLMPSHPSGLEVVHSTSKEQSYGSPGSDDVIDMSDRSTQSPVHQIQASEPRQTQPPALLTTNPPRIVDLPAMPPPANCQPKFLAFREILALKDPSDRIRAYNETRDQFANLNTGLAHWLAATSNDLPEHADLLTSSGRHAPIFQGHRPSQSRSKLSGLLPGGGQAVQQQWQPSAPDGNVPGNSLGASGSPQGYSPSGGSSGKLSSQQVQAKGKDLLHTAGVFGGKANVAAKGLFSKGKSKLRAASGNEKAASRSPGPESSQGMQQQLPIIKPHSSTEALADLRNSSGKAVTQMPSPAPQYLSQNPQHKHSQDTPSDTPSVESFTQSQLGDDERSDESEPLDQAHPPRTTSRYLKHGLADLKDSRSVQHPVTIGDNAPVFLSETPSADSYVGSPREIHTPQSTTSSNNRTPTQASFANGNLSVTLRSNRRDDVEKPSPWHEGLANRPQKQSSGDSKRTIRNVQDEGDFEEPAIAPQKPAGLPKAEMDLISRAPARMNALAASEVSATATDPRRSDAKPSKSRPVSSSRDSLSVPGIVQGNLNMGGTAPKDALEQRGRTGPIHYGLDHDFVPDSDHERARNRSRSDSRMSAVTRPSRDLRQSQERINDSHPAFQTSSDVPPQSYSGQISRENSPAPGQQAPEYQVEGVSHPVEWPTENHPRSRRGSKSSSFFRSLTLGSSSKVDEPPLPDAPESHSTPAPDVPPVTGERKRRASILRSLTGNSGGGSTSGQSKVSATPAPPVPQNGKSTPTAPIAASQVEDDEFPSRGNLKSAASTLSKRLQRSSTSGKTEQATGKKKRFSGIGSLFGRGNPKRHSSSTNPRTPSQQVLPAQSPQPETNAAGPPPSPKSQHLGYRGPSEYYTPPPPGGYYAPRPPQALDPPAPSDPRLQRDRGSLSRVQDAPAYVQDATLRQRIDHSISPPLHDSAAFRSSVTFPQTAPHRSSTGVPRASTVLSKNREALPERPAHESKSSGSSWTRFSQHGRSKSRQEQQRPSSNTSQQPTTYSSSPPSRNLRMVQQPYHDPSRSDSPPPPPPPPKDEMHHARPRESVPKTPNSRSSKHGPSPSQWSSRPMSTLSHQSLPPLQTNKIRQSTVASDKALTPEEKRKSRQLEIERSTIYPQYREQNEEEPPVVMSATSFPGQMWQPEYAHWDGD